MLTEEQKKQYLDYNCEDIAKFTELLVQDKSRLNYISWQDIADLVYDKFGVVHSRHWYSRNYDDKLSAYKSTDYNASRDPQDDFQDKLLELQKAKVKIADERNQNRAYVRRLAREETIKEIALEAVKAIGSKKLLPDYSDIIHTTSNNREDKSAILCLSDWHYGMEIDNIFNLYNPEICRVRINRLKHKVIQYCLTHNVNELYVLNLSDLIAGRIHLTIRLESRIDVITQVMEVSEILSELLADLSQYFTIHYYSCIDNHSRLEPNKTDSLDLESLCRIIDWYLKERLNNNNNININPNTQGSDIIHIKCRGFDVLAVHGDKDKKTQLERLQLMMGVKPHLLYLAHLHHFWVDTQNNVKIIGNGSVMGSDDYSLNLRLTSTPSQVLTIVSDDNATEAIYNIELD